MITRRTILAAAFAFPKIEIRLDEAASLVHVESGKIKTAFHYGERWPKPFLYPIMSPSGQVLSRAFPLETRANESTDHAWHRGLWIGHGDINGFDFWREIKPENTGRIKLTRSPMTFRLGFHVFSALFPPSNDKPIAQLRQQWEFAWRRNGFAIDVDFSYYPFTDPLRFADTDDGGFGLRLRDEFREDRGAAMLSDDGRRGTKALWGKPAKWIDYSANVNGQPAGVTIFDHPKSFRYPTEWHARPYGLNAANPIAHRSFHGKTAPSGAHEVPAGKSLDLRYRVLWHDGLGEKLNLNEDAPK